MRPHESPQFRCFEKKKKKIRVYIYTAPRKIKTNPSLETRWCKSAHINRRLFKPRSRHSLNNYTPHIRQKRSPLKRKQNKENKKRNKPNRRPYCEEENPLNLFSVYTRKREERGWCSLRKQLNHERQEIKLLAVDARERTRKSTRAI